MSVISLSMRPAIAILFVVLSGVMNGGRSEQPAQSTVVSVVMLGTGSPVPDYKAFGPATAVRARGRVFLFDAGPGVTRQLAAAGMPRIKEVEATFITHLHSDHTLGYPDLIFTTWIMGRRGPLRVFGPPGLRRMTDRLFDAWREDIELRITGLERETREWLAVDVTEISPGVVYEREGVRVTAFPVRHAEWKQAFGYRIDIAGRALSERRESKGRSVTISGDAAPSETLVAAAKGTDVLIHEVYIEGRLRTEDRPGGERWPEYMRAAHTSNVELGRLAARIEPGVLVLHHVLWMGGTERELIDGIRKGGFTGKVVVAKDLDVY